jgi:hypothetical protein
MTPIRANIVGQPSVATRINASIAALGMPHPTPAKPISSFAASRLAHQPLNSTENQQYPSDHRDRTKIEGLEETGAHQCERCSDRVAPFELCPTPEAYFRPSGLPRAVFGDQDTA